MARWSEHFAKPHLHGLPELELFPDERSRRDAIRRAGHELRLRPAFWIGSLAFIPLTMICVWALGRAVVYLTGSRPLSVEVVIGMLVGGASGLALARMARRDAARFLRERLLQCDVPVCLNCGYCLRGLVSDRCPECGKELDARVRELIGEDAQRDGSGPSEASTSS